MWQGISGCYSYLWKYAQKELDFKMLFLLVKICTKGTGLGHFSVFFQLGYSPFHWIASTEIQGSFLQATEGDIWRSRQQVGKPVVRLRHQSHTTEQNTYHLYYNKYPTSPGHLSVLIVDVWRHTFDHVMFNCHTSRVVWGIIGRSIGVASCPTSLWQTMAWFHTNLPGGERFHMLGMAAICLAI